MEQYRYKDAVRGSVRESAEPEFAGFSDVGIVVQAYLKDALEDLDLRAGWLNSRQRPVQRAPWSRRLLGGGASSRPERLARARLRGQGRNLPLRALHRGLLVAWPHLRPAFGTHNPRSIAQAVVKARARGRTEREIEFQMLFGMAEELRKAVAREGSHPRLRARGA
jgi:RHH-type proline utilization regulon transcriptional repressor/proline dehydrogenase/delta 1-pyrroline-5-carboxylate dehydrogenase